MTKHLKESLLDDSYNESPSPSINSRNNRSTKHSNGYSNQSTNQSSKPTITHSNGYISQGQCHSDTINMDDDSPVLSDDDNLKIAIDSSINGSDIPLMSNLQIFFYSNGHVLNDLCAACWFTYLLPMLRDRGINGIHSGAVLLCGQFADAFATPITGRLSDQSNGITVPSINLGCYRIPGFRIERRQTWYLIGTLIVAVNFFFVFGISLPLLITDQCPEWGYVLYYCVGASLFNVGWAAVQVSHMAMVPELSDDEHERVMLNSARYSESVIANIMVFIILAVLKEIYPGEAVDQYTYLAYLALGIGTFTSLLFMFGVREKAPKLSYKSPMLSEPLLSAAPISPSISPSNSPIELDLTVPVAAEPERTKPSLSDSDDAGWKLWLTRMDFWKVCWIYMCARLTVNVSQSFLVFYLQDTLDMSDQSTTVVPCIAYVASFLAALTMKRANARFGRKIISAIGTVFACGALTGMFFLPPHLSYLMYPLAVALGIGNGTIMVCSSQLPADLLGKRTRHAAFVYGALSFTDKFANGIALFLLQTFNGELDGDDSTLVSPTYIRLAVTILPFVAAFAAMVMLQFGLDLNRMSEQVAAHDAQDAEDQREYKEQDRQRQNEKLTNQKVTSEEYEH